jgi:hypothetical protein
MRRFRLIVGMAGLALMAFSVACGSGSTTGSAQVSADTPGSSNTSAAADTQRGAGGNPEPGRAPNSSNPTVPAIPTDPSAGSCDVSITGGENIKYTAVGGPSAAGSDYWMTADELRTGLRQLARISRSNATDAEIERDVNVAMQQDPRLFILIVNCVSGGNSISVLPGGDSKYADVPFAPKRYVIGAGGPLGGGNKNGEFSVLMVLQGTNYKVDEPGTLNITKFDATGIAGTFTFKASEFLFGNTGAAAKKVTVDAKFDYKCTQHAGCKR